MVSIGIIVTFLVAALIWWSFTALLLYLNRLPERTYRLSLAMGTFFVGAALAGTELSLSTGGQAAVYVGFLSAVILWGWLEMAHLMGFLMGPVRSECPPNLQGWRKFFSAINVALYHELAIIAVGVLLTLASVLVQGGTGIAAWTFCTLWFMRWSAKLNLYLGVANLHEEMLPGRLKYMASYMGHRNINPLFPVSVTLGTLLIAHHALSLAATDDPTTMAVAGLLTAITTLGVLEHWFLVLPIRDSALWHWWTDTDEQVLSGSRSP